MSRSLFWVSYIALWAMLLVLLAVTVAILRQIGVLHGRLGPIGALRTTDGPEIGSTFDRTLTARDGISHPLGLSSTPTLLVVVSSECGACRDLLPSLEPFSRQVSGSARLLVLTAEPHKDQFGLPASITVHDSEAVEAIGASVVPFAVLVSSEGQVLDKAIPNSMEQLDTLVMRHASAKQNHVSTRPANTELALQGGHHDN